MIDVVNNPTFLGVDVPMPTKEDISQFVVGRQIITPTGNRVVQHSFSGRKIKYVWNGLTKNELTSLVSLLNQIGHNRFQITLTTGEQLNVVLDGLNAFSYNKRYNYVSGRLRYYTTLNLIEVP